MLYRHAAYLTALLRSNLPDSHFRTDGIATDNMCHKFTHFLISANKRYAFCKKNYRHCFPFAKVVSIERTDLVLFGTYFGKIDNGQLTMDN